MADVKKPIIGADFLSIFRLLVNLRDRVVHDDVTSLQVVCLTQTLSSEFPPTFCKPVLEYPVRVSFNLSSTDNEFGTQTRVRAYHQSPMAPEDIAKMAIITPFGLLNAAQSFQRFMDRVFVEHHISGRKITQLPEKTPSILSYPAPQSVKSLCCFLGVVKYYRRVIPNCAHILQSLTDLLKGKPKHFKMTSEAESAFSEVKQELSKKTTSNHLDTSSGTRVVLKTNASQVAVGAVLQQVVKGETQPLSFFSKKPTTAETRYTTFGREPPAIYLAVKHFWHILKGRQSTTFTDHKPLIYTFRAAADPDSPSVIRFHRTIH
nr:gag pol polyprotein [Hymenolepis microstoma]